jgi:hypothetical protein
VEDMDWNEMKKVIPLNQVVQIASKEKKSFQKESRKQLLLLSSVERGV